MATFIRNETMSLSFKRRGWCLWHWLNECGWLTIQIGPFIAEIAI